MKNKTYEDFVNKFKRAKSSDETYTPVNIKRLLGEYVEQKPPRPFPNDFFTGAKLKKMAAHGERGFMKSSEFHSSLFIEGKKIKIFGGAIRGNFFRGENE